MMLKAKTSNGAVSRQDLVLTVEDLTMTVGSAGQRLKAVSDVSFSVRRGATLALVGESGCGKSMTALSLLRLLPAGVRIESGRIAVDGFDVTGASEHDLVAFRGNSAGMIFQDPMTALNPLMRVGEQIAEPLLVHKGYSPAAGRRRALDLLNLVRVPDPERRIDAYPHGLSGGLRQRVMIAIAMACEPSLLIADEPTTALDVTVQAQVLALFGELQDLTGTALLLITHDLGVVAETADDVAVMYAGRIVEYGPVEAVFSNPQHPYTRGLLSCVASPDERALCSSRARRRLTEIAGVVPSLSERGSGCAFLGRCSHSNAECSRWVPKGVELTPSHMVECCHVG